MLRVLLMALMALVASGINVMNTNAVAADKVFNVYTDKRAPDNHYIPSGWMGDFKDLSFDDMCMEAPHAGSTCIKVSYSAKKTQGEGWAGIYWQNPPNNWGSKEGGYDLSTMNKLTFWVRGELGGEIIEKVKIGGITGDYPDSCDAEIGPLKLTKEWKEYTINLAGKDLHYISGGLCLVVNSNQNPNGCTFYLDDMSYSSDPNLVAAKTQPREMPFWVYQDGDSLENHFIPSGWMGDFHDITMEQNFPDSPRGGKSCIKFVYSGKASQGARWAGVYWQNPANNWGDKKGGFDLSKATKLVFWARGEKGGEQIEEFKIGGIGGKNPDSDTAGIGPVRLTKEWKEYTIDLRGKNLSSVSGGFCWATNADVNPEGCTFYLDDVKYE